MLRSYSGSSNNPTMSNLKMALVPYFFLFLKFLKFGKLITSARGETVVPMVTSVISASVFVNYVVMCVHHFKQLYFVK